MSGPPSADHSASNSVQRAPFDGVNAAIRGVRVASRIRVDTMPSPRAQAESDKKSAPPSRVDNASLKRPSGIQLIYTPHWYGQREDPKQLQFAIFAALGLVAVTLAGLLFLKPIQFAVLVMPLGAAVVGVTFARRKSRSTDDPLLCDTAALPMYRPVATERLVCYGHTSELAPLRTVRDEQFEPFLARYYGRWASRALWVVVIGCCVWMPIAAQLGIVVWKAFFIGVAGILIASPIPRIVPYYWRVSPGRMELLRFPIFGVRGKVLKSIDLRGAGIECRYDKLKLVVHGPDELDVLAVDLRGVRPRHEFVEHVFRAAIVKPTDARLPSDALLG